MNKALEKTLNSIFLQLLEDLKGKKEIESFLKDFVGERDYGRLVKKLATVYWIRKNRPTEVIKNNLTVTEKEIIETKKIMNRPGIKLAIKYMEAEEFANVWVDKIKKLKQK